MKKTGRGEAAKYSWLGCQAYGLHEVENGKTDLLGFIKNLLARKL